MSENILSETICRFCFCAMFSNIYRKLNFMAKIGSDLCNFYSKLEFLDLFFIYIYVLFLLFCTDFKLMMFYYNIVKISRILNKKNLLKNCIQTNYPIDFCTFCDHFYYGKNENIRFFLNQ